MRVAGENLRCPFELWLIGRRAVLFSNPVDRLRYLQHSVSTNSGPLVPAPRPWLLTALTALFLCAPAWAPLKTPLRTADAEATQPAVVENPTVWLVDTQDGTESYSNGLRIDTSLATPGPPRVYRPLSRAEERFQAEHRTEPAGIVFHSSESDLAEFEPQRNGALRRIGRDLLSYVRSRRLYNFVIDRFGRVFRVVDESAVANHAGYSIWADDGSIYLNLNRSFLGICFEGRSESEETLTPAQLHSGRVLVAMLRSKYKIAARNCVTHGQVSVNPSNWRVGYHTDWAGPFPFQKLGLPDNHAQTLPAVGLFGFECDAAYRRLASPSLRESIGDAEREARGRAAAIRLMPDQYQAARREKYRTILAEIIPSKNPLEKR